MKKLGTGEGLYEIEIELGEYKRQHKLIFIIILVSSFLHDNF